MSRKQWGHGFYKGIKAASTSFKKKRLVGKYAFILTEKGKLKHQVYVSSYLGCGFYLVIYFEWFFGEMRESRIHHLFGMLKWKYYETREAFQYARDDFERS